MSHKISQVTTLRNYQVIEIIDHIESLPGKNDKTAFTKLALETNANFKSVVKATYDKFFIYGIKSLKDIPEFRNKKGGTTKDALAKFCDVFMMGVLAPGKSDAAMKMKLSKALDRLSTEEVKVVPLILKRNLGCGISSSTINKACPGLIPEFPVMLCDKANEKTLENISYPAIAQLKMDGLRCNAFFESKSGVVKFRTRNAKVLELHGVFDKEIEVMSLGDDVVFDGELVQVDCNGDFESRLVGNGIANKAIKGTITVDEAERFVFVVWDIIPLNSWKKAKWNVGYSDRLEILTERIRTQSKKIKLVETVHVNNADDVNLYYLSKIRDGEEGIILKNCKGIWSGKRSKDCLKFKVELENEFRITGIQEGTGRMKGFLGAFSVESEDGIVVSSVGTGLSADQREEYYTEKMIGKIITIKYNEIINNKIDPSRKSLFLPVFVSIREDKDIADTIDKMG